MSASDDKFFTDAVAISKALEGRLSERHALELAKSAISPDVARLRGYATIDSYKAISRLRVGYGFADYQCRIPGLLVPLWNVSGKQTGAHFKPDNPRKDDRGNIVKYENPTSARLIIDIPPICLPDLENPGKDLWIIDGIKKADSVASKGAVAGSVRNICVWCDTDEYGSQVILSCWESIALSGRRVFLAPESDPHKVTNPNVQAGANRLGNWLKSQAAKVFLVNLPSILPTNGDEDE